MRIHANTLNLFDIALAARVARVDLAKLTSHKSRKRDHAFDVNLEGESRRRPNNGASGSGSGYAATWDQWGVFLSVLFDIDPTMTCTYYDDRDHFDRKTAYRFEPAGIVDGPTVTDSFPVPNRSGAAFPETVYRVAGSYWPSDAHGDHRFRFDGIVGSQACNKCSARQVWA